jgi:hypothetical protein
MTQLAEVPNLKFGSCGFDSHWGYAEIELLAQKSSAKRSITERRNNFLSRLITLRQLVRL